MLKRWIAALLALMLLALPALAEMAEGNEPVDAERMLPGWIPENRPAFVDLDGDGIQEVVSWRYAPGEYEESLLVTVGSADGTAATCRTDILWDEQVYIRDLDGDGAQEILLSGDVMSADYVTYCLRYTGGALAELLFPDSGRGDENGDGYYKYGYGAITAIDGNRLVLSGSQDILGTWFATRAVTLTPLCRFEFDDDGIWVRDGADLSDAGLWEYAALTLRTSVAYYGAEGSPNGVLSPGDRIIPYASDKRDRVWFATPDGIRGVLSISHDYERGWGWLVEGRSEEELFEYVPYAD